MYIPRLFEERHQPRIDRLIRDYSFGLLLTADGHRPQGTHVPFLYEPGRLLCHLARANPQTKQLEEGCETLAVFSGPHAYISPTWYESPDVPTWNYAVVHVYGAPTAIRDEAKLRSLVERTAHHYEQGEADPWRPAYDPAMLRAIVGFEIAITEVLGNFKLSQNRPKADRLNVIERLRARGSPDSIGVAELMAEREAKRA